MDSQKMELEETNLYESTKNGTRRKLFIFFGSQKWNQKTPFCFSPQKMELEETCYMGPQKGNQKKPFYMDPQKMKLQETLLYGPQKIKLKESLLYGPINNDSRRISL